jgi:hypothetical protein
MKTIEGFKRNAATLGLCAAVLSGGCAVIEPKAERWSPPAAGSTWEVAQRNTGSYGKDVRLQISRGDGTWEGAKVVTYSNSLGMTTMATPDEGSWIAIVGRNGKPLQSFDPPLGWQYPIMVGKTWTTSYKVTTHATGKTIPFELACKVEDHGDVTVPAGTFKAFKIACTSTIGNEDTYWISPDFGIFVKTSLRRTEKSPLGPGTQEAELVSQAIRK